MELLVVPAILIAVVIYTAYPLLVASEASQKHGPDPEDPNRELLERRDELLTHLKDIEMDYRMGKLSEADYQNLRNQFEGQAVEVMETLGGPDEDKDLPTDA